MLASQINDEYYVWYWQLTNSIKVDVKGLNLRYDWKASLELVAYLFLTK